VRDYLAFLPLSFRPGIGTVAEAAACPEPLYGRLIQPMLLATLNNEPKESSAVLAAAVVRETVACGGRACRPMIATDGLSTAFVDPAVKFLAAHGAELRYGHKLRGISWSGDAVDVLDFGADRVALLPADDVIVAIPAEAAARVLPDVAAPTEFRAIANIHFHVEDPIELPPMIGLVNATTQWIFRFPDRVSVTISNADGLAGMGREELARLVWSEIEAVAGEQRPMPKWQVVQERRATFATVPDQEKMRPDARTRWKNLFLAGDWVATGLPPTIEGAVRSGRLAAELSADGGR
jgi:squalene-associated FAD-dependent desaturase